ncbi:hypothetical protein QOZ80_4AG0320550 [Eleusine coracana subsp. coracana]|nr:hypothetical protein QOZ80_4AG0320550 [Eleusine coracana subsp. coracana]
MPTPTTRPEKRRRTTLPHQATIPDDLLISEIFLRLPVDSLVRVKCVCRSWRAAVEDPAFVRRHLDLSRARTPPSLLVIPSADDPDDHDASESSTAGVISIHRLVLDRARNDDTDVALVLERKASTTNGIFHPTHCDGLVALATPTGQVFVCNPATREFVAVPPGTGSKIDATAAVAIIGHDTWRDKYVVARYFYRRYDQFEDVIAGLRWLDYDIGHEIFTLGSGECSWTPTPDPPLAVGPASPVCTREAVYWCTEERYGPNALLRFGLRDRAFHVVSCPEGTSFRYGGYNLTELDGNKLCYVDANYKTNHFDFWVADDDGSRLQEWALRCRVDFDLFGRPGVGEDALFPVAVARDEMILAADYKELYRYDAPAGKSVNQFVDLEEELPGERPDGTPCLLRYHVVPYVESLVPVSARSQLQLDI